MKKILLLAPRLDISFRDTNTPIPKDKGQVLPDKKLWSDFLQRVIDEYHSRSDIELTVLEMPLFKFRTLDYSKYDFDQLLVPHHEVSYFPKVSSSVYFYMQTTFPWIFSVDSKGWAAGASVYPYSNLYSNDSTNQVFDILRDRAKTNKSKFAQPEYSELNLPDNYILFACQLPHDETIKYHSNIGVGKALTYSCEATKKLGIPLVVKGHPIRPDIMIGFRDQVAQYKHVTFIQNASIHQLIESSRAVITVNSGTGMEALLHHKPVINFGRAEYDCVTNHANKENILDVLKNLVYDQDSVNKFFDGWYNWCYDINVKDSFKKLP